MLKNYFRVAVRNLLRFKAYTLINFVGLSMGLSVAVLILLFVIDETGYDKFHENSKRIYKITTANPNGDGMETNAWPVGYKLQLEFPEVESVLYTRRAGSSMKLNVDGKRFEHELFYASDEFLNIFSFSLLSGEPSTALTAPFSILITEEIKQQYFGDSRALGEIMIFEDSLEFTVTGVLENIPSQSHIQFDMLASFSTYERINTSFSYSEGWGNFNMRNYVLLKEGANIRGVSASAKNMYMDNVGDWLNDMGVEFHVNFIPLQDVYLKSDISNGFGPKGSLDQVYLVSAIAMFIVLLACINFITITTARSVYRAKEVGLRKIVGSSRSALIFQFMSESLIVTLMAFCSVGLVADLSLPMFNELMNKDYSFASLFSLPMAIGAILLVIFVSFLSGFYPAKVISGFKPLDALSGKLKTGAAGIRLRRILVVFQFVVSAGLVLGTLIVLGQLNYMQNQDLGFDKEQVLVLDVTGIRGVNSPAAFKNALGSHTSITNVSYANALPGRPGWRGQWAFSEALADDEHVDTEYMAVDEDYIGTLGLELIAGKNFDLNNVAELDEGVIINETAVKQLGWESPQKALGKKITSPSKHPEGTIIGVVKDYHGLGLQSDIWPKVLDYKSEQYGRYFAIRFETGSTTDLIDYAESVWSEHYGDYVFDYFFLDQDFDRQYKAEDRLMNVLIVFAIVTIIIASIGLLGLVSFMIVARTKEIGIRKVLGANAFSITNMLSKEFVILVFIGNVIAGGLVWYLGNSWLSEFSYHMSISPSVFVVTLLATVSIAILTISFQTTRAARQNPVDSMQRD